MALEKFWLPLRVWQAVAIAMAMVPIADLVCKEIKTTGSVMALGDTIVSAIAVSTAVTMATSISLTIEVARGDAEVAKEDAAAVKASRYTSVTAAKAAGRVAGDVKPTLGQVERLI